MVASLTVTSILPALAAAAVVALVWVVRYPVLAIGALMLSIIAGQAWRLPLPGQGGGLLLSDIAVLLVLAAAALEWWQKPARRAPFAHHLVLLLVPSLIFSAALLFFHTPTLPTAELMIALAYWLRLSTYLLLIPALLVLWRQSGCRQLFPPLLMWTTLALIILGLAQRIWLPHLSGLSGGWDPHSNRLVSTWLDPNFFGGLLAVLLPWYVVQACSQFKNRNTDQLTRKQNINARVAPQRAPQLEGISRGPQGLFLQQLGDTELTESMGESAVTGPGTRKNLLSNLIVILFIGLALILTESRSSFVALGLGLLIASPFYVLFSRRKDAAAVSVRLVSAVLLTALGLGVAGVLLGSRVVGILTFDPTVTLRLSALQTIWPTALEHTWLGVGYNAYQFVALKSGVIGNFAIHSRAGADNSLLTLWMTMGLPGVLLLSLPAWFVISRLSKRALFGSSLAATTLLCGLIWLLHSQFVNSLLYGHLLIVMAALIAYALTEKPDATV